MKFTLSIAFCDPTHYMPLARAADVAGWDAVSVLEGLFYYYDADYLYPISETGTPFWTPATPYLDPFAVSAAIAAVTENVQIYTNVVKLAVRHPLAVAKSAASVAALSNDRFGLGVGLGAWPQDYELLGQDWDNRGPRSSEMVEILRAVLRGGRFEFHGRYYEIPPLEIAPVPAKPLPIYFGGHADAVLRRAAELGDGYIGAEDEQHTLDALPDLLKRLRTHLAAAGRNDADFEIKYVPGSVGIDVLKRLRDAGVTDAVVWPWLYFSGDPGSLSHKIASIRRFRDEIYPLFAD